MGLAAEVATFEMPVDTNAFSTDPMPCLALARQAHPWLARFSQGYVIHGYQAVCDLASDDVNLVPGLGSLIEFYGVGDTEWAEFIREMVISQSGPQHARLRASVSRAFMPRRANAEREKMRQVITSLLDEWAPPGQFDFAQFAAHFPVTVMFGLLGLSPEPVSRIRNAIEDHMASLSWDPAARPLFLSAWDELRTFADTLVREREASGIKEEESLLDNLIAARNAGDLDEKELRYMLLSVIIAGYDTSKNQLAMTMKLLLDRPEIYRRCAEDHAFCGKVVQESLRHSAIATIVREVARDFDYSGVTFCKGDALILLPALANRDPSIFPDPMEFDTDRENANRHVAFGRGAHICLGQFIARNQLQEGLHLIAQRLRNPRLCGEIQWRPILGAWGPGTLPIAFDT